MSNQSDHDAFDAVESTAVAEKFIVVMMEADLDRDEPMVDDTTAQVSFPFQEDASEMLARNVARNTSPHGRDIQLAHDDGVDDDVQKIVRETYEQYRRRFGNES